MEINSITKKKVRQKGKNSLYKSLLKLDLVAEHLVWLSRHKARDMPTLEPINFKYPKKAEHRRRFCG
jgi:hypothetical protein